MKLWSYKRTSPAKRVAMYLAPSDFNSIKGGELVPDKLHHLFSLLEKMGLEPVYLMRYSTSTVEYLPLKTLVKNHRILQVKIQVLKILLIKLSRVNNANIFANKEKSGESTLSQISEASLRATLDHMRPKLIFAVGATQELIGISHSLGIKIIEVMHGIIADEGIYHTWGSPTSKKPDLILTWHDHFSEIVKKLDLNATTLGYPDKISKRRDNPDSSRVNVLVSLGHSDPESEDPYGTISKELFQQVQLFKNDNINIVFRIHPVISSDFRTNKKVIRWINENFNKPEIHSPRSYTLFRSLENVDVHVTKYSSTYFEAALLEIPTIFTDNIYELHLPKELFEAQLAIQGGDLEAKDLLKFASNRYKSPFNFMKDVEFYEIVSRTLGS